jgi:ADP-ribose pyrophosphatase
LKPKRLARNTIYRSEWVSLHLDRVELPGGDIIEEYHVIDFPRESVAALVLDEAGRLLLVRIHRHVVGRTGWEVPAGGIDDGESPLAAAAREVLEETGTETGSLQLLGSYHPSNGSTNQTVHVVRCKATTTSGIIDPDEIIEAAWFTRAQLDALLDAGEIRDGLTLTALFFLQRARSESGSVQHLESDDARDDGEQEHDLDE